MPKLIIQQPDREWTIELREGPNVIGRSSKNQVPVNDTNISREHCEVVLADGVATLVDKGSMNGTLLNGTRVWERKLEPGDKIQIGTTAIWFEQKKEGAAPTLPVRPVDTKVRTKVISPEKPPSSPAQPAVSPKKTDTRRTANALVKDYSAFASAGVNLRLVLGTGIGVVLVGAAIAVAMIFSGRSTQTAEDKDNLIKEEGGFEWAQPGKPNNWSVRPSGISALAVAESPSHGGKKCLELRKGPAPAESLVDVEFADKIPVGAFGTFEVSAWAKWGDFAGSCCVKVAWLYEGAVFLEEYSAPIAKGPDWKAIKGTFRAPAGVKEFRVGLSTSGRGGLIQFDDVRVAGKQGGTSHPTVAADPFKLTISEGGAITVQNGSKVVLSNLHVRLENDLEGVTTQLHAQASLDGKTIKGTVPHPVSGAEVPFEVSLFTDRKNELGFGWEFKSSDLAQVTRVALVAQLPRTERLRIPEEAASQIEYAAGEDYQIAFLNQKVKCALREGNRIHIPFAVAEGNAAFILRRLADRATRKNPLDAAREVESEQPAKALQILRGAQADPTLEEGVARDIGAMIQKLEQREGGDWRNVEAKVLVAELISVPSLLEAANAEVDRYDRLWGGDKSRTVRKRLTDVSSTALPGRPSVLLDRAKQLLDEGHRTLAEWILAGIVAVYGNTEAGEEARKMLSQLKSGG